MSIRHDNGLLGGRSRMLGAHCGRRAAVYGCCIWENDDVVSIDEKGPRYVQVMREVLAATIGKRVIQ